MTDVARVSDYRQLANYIAYTVAADGVSHNIQITATVVPAFEQRTALYRRALIMMDVGIIGGGDSLSFDLQVGDGTTFGTVPGWTTEVFTSSRHAGGFVANVNLEKLTDKFVRGRISAVTGTVIFGASMLLYKPQYPPVFNTFFGLSQDI